MVNPTDPPTYEDGSPDIYYCAIHYGHFSMDEEGGCPECTGEWSPAQPGDELLAEDNKSDAG